ncbi:hypothetical protein SDC9_206528 [bioreactor metagenome]|uniref:Uncharacterized protein n=1 Tax=bioreactor metagenome TaxID=1076179 RepID=A0A645JGV3_9ZZZZ
MSNTRNTPENKITDKLSEVKMKRDANFQFTNLNGKLEPDLNILSKQENTKVVEKKIVNNKPSQFRPVMGINFHMIKK